MMRVASALPPADIASSFWATARSNAKRIVRGGVVGDERHHDEWTAVPLPKLFPFDHLSDKFALPRCRKPTMRQVGRQGSHL